MRPAFILTVIAALALSPSVAGAEPDSLPAIMGLSVNLDQTTQPALVTDSAQGTVQFTGQVTVDKPPVARAVVTLDSDVDTGWASELSPSSMVFTSTTPMPFTVTAVVPEKTLSTLIGKLLVRATMTSAGQTAEATANATITVEQYYLLELSSDAPFFESDRTGVSATYKVLVTNKGNGPDTFALGIGNLADLRSKGWTARLDREVTPVVQPGLEGEVGVTLTSPKETSVFEAMTVAVMLTARSVGASAQNQTIGLSFPLYYHLNAIDPVFDVTFPIIIITVVAASVAVAVWRWRKKRARRAPAAPDPDGPVDVGPDEKVADE